jgi:hypothetical protein
MFEPDKINGIVTLTSFATPTAENVLSSFFGHHSFEKTYPNTEGS